MNKYIEKLRKKITLIKSIRYKYLIYGSIVIVEKGSSLLIKKHCKIYKSKIVVKGNYKVIISDNCQIQKSTLAFFSANNLNESIIGSHTSFSNVKLQCYGQFKCGEWNIFDQCNEEPMLTTFKGSLLIGHHNRFKNKFWIRFNAKIIIGNYNNINERSWLRADELIEIGDYNMISYDVKIWDTNTHNIYSPQKRRMLTEKYFPFFGYETEKPVTKPIIIKSDCWIAQNVAIFKGSELGEHVTLGFGTFLSNKKIPSNTTVVNKTELRLIQ